LTHELSLTLELAENRKARSLKSLDRFRVSGLLAPTMETPKYRISAAG
jgi:hypothetical protein